MARVSHRDPAERLHALGEQIDELELLVGVLVEEQVQLVEGRARNQPVMFLVQRVKNARIRQDAIQKLAALAANLIAESDRQRAQRVEALDLFAELGRARPGRCLRSVSWSRGRRALPRSAGAGPLRRPWLWTWLDGR